ncbi:MAG: CoA pyrophosphatase [Parvularculales bacterium]
MRNYQSKIINNIDNRLSYGAETLADHDGLIPAAVLVPVVERPAGPVVLLTRRAETLPQHSGQIAFPGGKINGIEETPTNAALRETKEEIGLDRSFIEVAGFLDMHTVGSGFSITPVVGFVRSGFTLCLDAGEVDEVFEVPLSFLMNPSNHQHHKVERNGVRRCFYAIPYEDYNIWGATAGILRNLYERVFAL